jgi:hypothetical protein
MFRLTGLAIVGQKRRIEPLRRRTMVSVTELGDAALYQQAQVLAHGVEEMRRSTGWSARAVGIGTDRFGHRSVPCPARKRPALSGAGAYDRVRVSWTIASTLFVRLWQERKEVYYGDRMDQTGPRRR